MNERSDRVRLHLLLNTYRAVLGLDALPWAEVERAEMGLLAASVAELRREADLAIEADRLANRIDQQGEDWSE